MVCVQIPKGKRSVIASCTCQALHLLGLQLGSTLKSLMLCSLAVTLPLLDASQLLSPASFRLLQAAGNTLSQSSGVQCSASLASLCRQAITSAGPVWPGGHVARQVAGGLVQESCCTHASHSMTEDCQKQSRHAATWRISSFFFVSSSLLPEFGRHRRWHLGGKCTRLRVRVCAPTYTLRGYPTHVHSSPAHL